MGWLIWLGLLIAFLVALARVRASFMTWSLVVAGVLLAAGFTGLLAPLPGLVIWTVFLLVALPLNVPALRRTLLSDPMLARTRDVLPPMSQTERDAIESGTV